MIEISPADAKAAIDQVLLAAREQQVRNIQISIRPDVAFIRFSHEEWTKVHDQWEEDFANQVMLHFFKEIERTNGKPDGTPPEEGFLTRNDQSSVGIRARVTTIPLWPEGFDVILNLL